MQKGKARDYELRILYNLSKRGYPLTGINQGKEYPMMPVEELFIEVLSRYKKPRAIEGLPVIAIKNPIDYERLCQLAQEQGVTNEVGFMLDNIRSLLREFHVAYDSTGLERAMEKLRKSLEDEEHYLAPLEVPYYHEAVKSRQLPKERKWRVLGIFPYRNFKHQFRTYL